MVKLITARACRSRCTNKHKYPQLRPHMQSSDRDNWFFRIGTPCRMPPIRGVRSLVVLTGDDMHDKGERKQARISDFKHPHLKPQASKLHPAAQHNSTTPAWAPCSRCSSDKCLECRQAGQVGNDSHAVSDSSSSFSSLQQARAQSRKFYVCNKTSNPWPHTCQQQTQTADT